jgi:hypothetical protein
MVLIFFSIPSAAQMKDGELRDDHIVLTDGRTIHGLTNIVRTPDGGNAVTLDDSVLFSLSNVSSFTMRNSRFSTLQRTRGRGRDMSFEQLILKRIVAGRIDIFTSLESLRRSPREPQYEYFSKGSDQLKEVTVSDLTDAMEDKPECVEILSSTSTMRIVKYGLMAAGGAMTGYGLFQSAQDAKTNPTGDVNINPFLYVGLGIFAGSFIPDDKAQENIRAAVQRYNVE